MANKPALGKGLASLFPGVNPPSSPSAQENKVQKQVPPFPETPNRDRHPGITVAALEDIVANEYQPRRDFVDETLEELAQSIRENGIIQPLVVRKGSRGFQLIAGERRLRAAKIAGLKHVPVVIRKSTDREALELALIENIQRENLNCVDEALAYFQLMQDFSLTQEELAKRVGKDRATVANYLRILRLPEAVIDDLKKQILSFGHGKALLATDDQDIRLYVRQQIVEKKLSVRDTEALVSEMKRRAAQENSPAPAIKAASEPKDPIQTRLYRLAQDLTRNLSIKVELKGSEKRGKMVIHYGSAQDLERILNAVQNKEIWPETKN